MHDALDPMLLHICMMTRYHAWKNSVIDRPHCIRYEVCMNFGPDFALDKDFSSYLLSVLIDSCFLEIAKIMKLSGMNHTLALIIWWFDMMKQTNRKDYVKLNENR